MWKRVNIHFATWALPLDHLSWLRIFGDVLQSDSWWTQALKQNDKWWLASLQAEGSIGMPQQNNSKKQLMQGLSSRQWMGTSLCMCVGSVLFFTTSVGGVPPNAPHVYFYMNCTSHSRTTGLYSHSSGCLVQGQSINVLLAPITRAQVSLPRKYLRCMKIKQGDPTLWSI